MSSQDAVRKFWETTELIEHMLPYLDSKATMVLAQNHEKTLNILKGSVAWNKMIRRSCPWKGKGIGKVEEGMQEKINVMKNLVAILRLMDVDHRSHLMLDLLDLICKKFRRSYDLTVGCVRHPGLLAGGHIVSLSGFRLLEVVEGGLGTAEQHLTEITLAGALMDPALTALAARASRQQERVARISASYVALHTKTSAEAFNTLLRHSTEGGNLWGSIKVLWNIGEEGWKALAEAVQQPAFGFFTSVVYTTKRALDGGRREDIEKVFQAVPYHWWVRSDHPPYKHKEAIDYGTVESKWTRLVKILDTSMQDWAAQPLPYQMESDDEVEELEDENQEEEVARVDGEVD